MRDRRRTVFPHSNNRPPRRDLRRRIAVDEQQIRTAANGNASAIRKTERFGRCCRRRSQRIGRRQTRIDEQLELAMERGAKRCSWLPPSLPARMWTRSMQGLYGGSCVPIVRLDRNQQLQTRTRTFPVGAQWQQHSCRWSDFDADGRDIERIRIAAGPTPGPFELLIDDFEFR